jgi:hypothetical protein
MSGNLVVTDHINKLEAEVTYNPAPKSAGYFKSFKSKLWGGSTKTEEPVPT